VWGSRTQGGRLFSSRNLDWNSNTGIDQFTMVAFFDNIQGAQPGVYAIMGFTVGLGALAGHNSAGLMVPEMNLDNEVVTFNGMSFVLRLRAVLENASTLQTAMALWNSTNNTNSFNFLIASAADNAAYALETIRGFTQQYAANSPVEQAATVQCPGSGWYGAYDCHGWTNETGAVRIGATLSEAVYRSNHAFSPTIMRTQEPLFNDTVFRYMLQHDLISALTGTPIDDVLAVSVAASLGTKGRNFLTCAQSYEHGENVMSISYAPSTVAADNYFYIAWEEGKGSQVPWVPAACKSYVRFDFSSWM